MTNEEFVQHAQQLNPLQKVHYSWPVLSAAFDEPNHAVLKEYARLTNAISLRNESATPEQVQVAIQIAHEINQTTPSIPCSLGINHSPYHRRFDKTFPPTDTGPTYDAEIQYLKDKLQAFKDNLATANALVGADIKLTAILFDSEIFKWKHNPQTVADIIHNNAMDAKNDIVYATSKEVYPDVQIVQYGRGHQLIGNNPTGYMQAPNYTLKEAGEFFSASLYRVHEPGVTYNEYTRTVAKAVEHGVDYVIPWIALGAAYMRKVDQFRAWQPLDYDPVYSYQIGEQVNVPWFGSRPEQFPEFDRAPFAVFFPAPFLSTTYTEAEKHFLAYVMGANQTRTLPE